MIFTRKHIVIAVLFAVVGIAIGMGIKHYETLQTFSSSDIKVVLDAGHGEPDGGAVGVSGVVEKDINLAIVQKLQEVLESKGFEVILTRSGDSGLQDENAETIRKMKVSDMNKRLDIMKNSHADIFVSIHMNSFGDQKVSGLHIFYDKNHPEIERLAKSIQNKMSEVTGAEMHAVKTADERLFLMKNPPMPAILVECGFLSNPDEEKKLASDEYQSKIAWAIASAIEIIQSDVKIKRNYVKFLSEFGQYVLTEMEF